MACNAIDLEEKKHEKVARVQHATETSGRQGRGVNVQQDATCLQRHHEYKQ